VSSAGAEGITRDQFLALCAAYNLFPASASSASSSASGVGAVSAEAGVWYDEALSTLTERLARAPAIDKDKEKRKKAELAAKKGAASTSASAAASASASASASAAAPAPAAPLESNKLVAFIQKLGEAQEAAEQAAAASSSGAAAAPASAAAAGAALPRSAFATPKEYSAYLYSNHFGTPAPNASSSSSASAGFEFHLSKTTHGIDGKVMPFVLFTETLFRYAATQQPAAAASAASASAASGEALLQRFQQLSDRLARLHPSAAATVKK
jgi:hypothetical protein